MNWPILDQFVPPGNQVGFAPSVAQPISQAEYIAPVQNNTQAEPSVVNPPCPICGGPTKLRASKNDPNKKFYGCEGFPTCNGVLWIKEDGLYNAWKPRASVPSTSTSNSVGTESSVNVPNNYGTESSEPVSEDISKRIAQKRLNIYNNSCAIQVTAGEYDDKKSRRIRW